MFLKLIFKKIHTHTEKKAIDMHRLLLLTLGMSLRQRAASLQSTQLVSINEYLGAFSLLHVQICSEIKKESIKGFKVLLNLPGRGLQMLQ